jgi:hypothetical protein
MWLGIPRWQAQRQGMIIDEHIWKKILCEAIITRADEISCDECYAKLDRFAELILEGNDAANLMPRVYDHLLHCPDCREESEALVIALRGTAQFASSLD